MRKKVKNLKECEKKERFAKNRFLYVAALVLLFYVYQKNSSHNENNSHNKHFNEENR